VFELDSAAYSVPYVAGWAGTTPEEVAATIKDAGNRVMAAAKTILAAVTPTNDTEDDQIMTVQTTTGHTRSRAGWKGLLAAAGVALVYALISAIARALNSSGIPTSLKRPP
jgi:nitrogen fixation protein FixH